MILTACKQNLLKFDLLDVFTIMIPEDSCFAKGHSDYGKLQVNDDGDLVTCDLFLDYLRITPVQAAASTRWQAGFLLKEELK